MHIKTSGGESLIEISNWLVGGSRSGVSYWLSHVYIIRLCAVLLPLLLLLLPIRPTRLDHFKIFDDVTTKPSTHPLRCYGKYLFRNVHIDHSLHTNFQPDANILKFSMMSPTTPFWTDKQTDKCYLMHPKNWQSLGLLFSDVWRHPWNSPTLANSPQKVTQKDPFPSTQLVASPLLYNYMNLPTILSCSVQSMMGKQ